MLRVIGTLGGIRIAVLQDPDVEHGHQHILLSPNGGGAFLAALLDPEFNHRSHKEVFTRVPGWISIPHNVDVDERLIQFVDVCAEIRRQAPSLTQLSIFDSGGGS